MPSPKISFKDPWRRPDVSIDQRPSYNTMESHHDRASAGSSQTDRRVKKAAHRSSNLTISLSPRTSRSSYPVASPQKPSARSVPNIAVPPEATVQRAMSANAHLPLMRSPDTLDHFSLTDPYAPQPEESRDPSVGHAEIPGERSASAATVRGPSACERGPTPPLTPFPPWVGNSDDGEESEAREWEGPHHQRDHPTNKRGNEGHGHEHHVAHEKKWLFSSVIHGVVLALQAATALAIFSAMAFIIVWKKNKGEADFWSWMWKYAEPGLGATFLLCSGTLIAHEVKTLSTVALLYLQSAILAITTVTSMILWARCFEERSRGVKGLLLSANVFMWCLSFFGFIRAVVLWMAEVNELGKKCKGMSYGTFESSSTRANGERTRGRDRDRM